jgi:hypothetical protein
MTEKLTIQQHVELAHRHAQKALDLSYSGQPQNVWVRMALGRVQSILINLIVEKKLKG